MPREQRAVGESSARKRRSARIVWQKLVHCLCPASLCCQLFIFANTETALNSHALFRYNKLEREQISSLIFLGKGL